MDELQDILHHATASIDYTYFHLALDGGSPVYRERVYCYELYHQMRMRWPEDNRYVLNGEVDKIAHPILRKLGADHQKPDFLVHTPGSMDGNLCIMEVKHVNGIRNTENVRKDLSTLDTYQKDVGYRKAIYLIYGFELSDVDTKRIVRLYDSGEFDSPIELWFHSEVNAPAQIICVLDKNEGTSDL